jgi:hypothetical protein
VKKARLKKDKYYMFLLICGTYTLNDNDIYDDYKNNKGIGM